MAKIRKQIVGKRIDCHQVLKASKLAKQDEQMSNKVGGFRREREGNGLAAWTQSFEMNKVAVGDTHVSKIRRGTDRMEPGSESGRIMPKGMRQHCKESVAVKEWCEINKNSLRNSPFSCHLSFCLFKFVVTVRPFRVTAPEGSFRVTRRRPVGEPSLTMASCRRCSPSCRLARTGPAVAWWRPGAGLVV